MNLRETRNQLVAKDNRLIQNSRFALNLLENKAILYLISQIKPTDEKGKIYVFNCKEFQSLLNWSTETSYQKVKIMLQNLGDMSIWIDGEVQGRKKDILVRWFNIVHLDPGNGDIEISFHDDMFPFLLDLQKHMEEDGHYYTTYKLQNVTLMKHRYSIKIYELLKSYQYNNKKWTFENGTGSKYDLQVKIADTVIDKNTRKSVTVIPEGWSNWAIFKRNVLDPTIKEINTYSDIKVNYDGKKEDIHHRKTRAIRTIEFYMVGKTVPEQKRTDDFIDAEYTEIEDSKIYRQMTLDDLSVEGKFFADHNDSLKEEQKELELEKELEIERQADLSKYKILFHSLNGKYTEKQGGELYNEAIKGRVVGVVPFEYWELFATDLITYYDTHVDATMDKTKTTPYNRLLDMVRKDYKGKVNELLVNYTINK